MKTKLAAFLASTALLLGAFGGVASADPGNGQAVGQDTLQQAITRCSNAGAGNGGELLDGDDDDLTCVTDSGTENSDRDPTKAVKENNAPPVPPGQAP